MDTSSRMLSQPPFLHQLELLAVSSVEREDERQAVHQRTYPVPGEPPCLQLRGRQRAGSAQGGRRNTFTAGTAPGSAHRRSWGVRSDFFICWARKQEE